MNWLKTLTLGVCAFSLIYTLVKSLTPNKYQQQIKTVLSFVFALFIGSMVLGFDVSDLDNAFSGISDNYNISQENRFVIDEIEARLSDYLQVEIENVGIYPEKVTVKTNIDDNLCISISEARVVLNNSDSLKAEAVRKIVSQKIGDIDVIIEFSEE